MGEGRGGVGWGGGADGGGEGCYRWAWLAWGYHPVQIFL